MFDLSNTIRNFRSLEILPPVYKVTIQHNLQEQKKNNFLSSEDRSMIKEKLGKHYFQSLKFQEGLEVLNARAKLTINQKLQKLMKKKQKEEMRLKQQEKKEEPEYYYDVY